LCVVVPCVYGNEVMLEDVFEAHRWGEMIAVVENCSTISNRW